MEGMTLCSQGEATAHNKQEDGRVKGKGGGRQSLKHIDGCMRYKDKDVEED